MYSNGTKEVTIEAPAEIALDWILFFSHAFPKCKQNRLREATANTFSLRKTRANRILLYTFGDKKFHFYPTLRWHMFLPLSLSIMLNCLPNAINSMAICWYHLDEHTSYKLATCKHCSNGFSRNDQTARTQ